LPLSCLCDTLRECRFIGTKGQGLLSSGLLELFASGRIVWKPFEFDVRLAGLNCRLAHFNAAIAEELKGV